MSLPIAHKMTTVTLIGFMGLGALALSSCGIKGELKAPPPVWGDKSQKTDQKFAPQKADNNLAHHAKSKSEKRKQK